MNRNDVIVAENDEKTAQARQARLCCMRLFALNVAKLKKSRSSQDMTDLCFVRHAIKEGKDGK
jgi:hypothetical protein